MRSIWHVLGAMLLAIATLGASAGFSDPPNAPPAKAEPGGKVEPPKVGEDKPRNYAGLHNVVAYHEGFWAGSAPDGAAGFETLLGMGIKTIISVDGSAPDVEEARAKGLRYIHLPIGYNGFDEQRKLELVRAVRDAMKDGPVYIHCHHGKHRAAGAAATIAASLGWMTPEEAVARMQVSGTAPNYKGLYTCAADAAVLDKGRIDAVSANFPEVSRPAGFLKCMVEIDEVDDNLKAIEKASWGVPKDHPDLVPAAEAGRMVDLFRNAIASERAKAKGEEFETMLKTQQASVQKLEDLLAAGEKDTKKLSDQFKVVVTACNACHAKYRD